MISDSGKLQRDDENGEYKELTLSPARVVAQAILWDFYEQGITILPEIVVSVFGGFYFQWDRRVLNVHGNGKVSFVGEEIIKPASWNNVREECLVEIIMCS